MSGASNRGDAAGAGLLREIPRSRIVVDRVDGDTLRLARVLYDLGGTVTVADTRPRSAFRSADLQAVEELGIRVLCDTDLNETGPQVDVLFVHDYTSPLQPFVVRARRHGRVVSHWADLLLELTPATVIGVTGSAGKSTTARMIAAALAADGRAVYIPQRHELLGSANPNWEMLEALDVIDPRGVMVLELTSSHLEYMRHSPDIAVMTTLSPDHIEWHGSLERYLQAKAQILDGQNESGWAVLNCDEDIIRKRFWPRARGTVAGFGWSEAGAPGAYVRNGDVTLRWDGEYVRLLPTSAVGLPGRYLGNALAAAVAAAAAGALPAGIAATLQGFRGLPGRLELVSQKGDISVYNDGIALTPRKASAALETFPPGSVMLICGGEDVVDGWSVAPMHQAAEEEALLDMFAKLAVGRVKRAYVLGSAGYRLRYVLERNGFEPERISQCESLEEATTSAVCEAAQGDNVVLTPVFDIGERNLEDFRNLVQAALVKRRTTSPSQPA